MGPGLHRGIGMDIPRVRRAGRLKTREILLVSAGLGLMFVEPSVENRPRLAERVRLTVTSLPVLPF